MPRSRSALPLACELLVTGICILRVKIAILTTPGELYHAHICARIAARHELVAILHPAAASRPGGKRSAATRLHTWRQTIAAEGWGRLILDKLGANPLKKFGWDLPADIRRAERELLPASTAEVFSTLQDKTHVIADIHGHEAITLLQQLDVDVVLASGGPIYRPALIESVPLVLNFHTGISPLYNGTDSAFWPFANGHPQLTGGTLMVMSPKIDGGDILAHCLPAIEADDTPGRLLVKTIEQGIELASCFLDMHATATPFTRIPQDSPMHFTRSADWSVHHDLMLARNLRQQICSNHVRGPIRQTYWDIADEQAAREALEQFLLRTIHGRH